MLGDYGRWTMKDPKNNLHVLNEELQKAPTIKPKETISNETEERKTPKEKLRGLINNITTNMCMLEESVTLSHYTERMIFQNELQLLIDRHLLDFELDREKCKNARLKRMNNSDHIFSILSPSDQEEIKYLRKKCQNLTAVMKKRSGQINKALAQIRALKSDKESLKLQIKEKDSKIKEMFSHYSEALLEMNQKVRKMKEEADKEKQKYIENNLQIALKEQIKQNKQLIYNNCQLKTQIAQSKTVDKFNIATQVSLTDISKQIYHKDVSG